MRGSARPVAAPRAAARMSVKALASPAKKAVKKVVLAYSGGLDTSIILKWLTDAYPGCEVITFTADLGQERHVAQHSGCILIAGACRCRMFAAAGITFS